MAGGVSDNIALEGIVTCMRTFGRFRKIKRAVIYRGRAEAVTTPAKMVAALKQFNEQVVQAKNAGALDEEMAMDAQHHITQVIIHVSKPTTNRVFVLKHLTAAMSCVATVSAFALALSAALQTLLKLIG
jgi:hypothetical protein